MKKKCEVCGRETNRTYRVDNKVVCSKHMHQWYKYHKFLDSNPRTQKDLNEYYIDANKAYFYLYDTRQNRIGKFVIDLEDIEKVKYRRWRISHQHVVTGQPAKSQQRDLSWVVLGIDNPGDNVIDHINGDPLDNCKQNLRICKQKENVINRSFMSNNTSNFIGVSFKKDRNTWDPEIRRNGIRCHLGATKSLKEAVYKRYIAEQLIFQEYANIHEQAKKKEFTDDLPEEIKQKLYQQTIEKLRTKKLWQ